MILASVLTTNLAKAAVAYVNPDRLAALYGANATGGGAEFGLIVPASVRTIAEEPS